MRLCRVGVTEITLYPFGADIRRPGELTSYRSDFLIYGAGIAANLAAALLCLPWRAREPVIFFQLCNLMLAALNMMPVSLLDGGGMMHCVLCRYCGYVKAERIGDKISFLTVVILWIFSLYILFYTSSNFSLFLLSAYLFATLYLPSERKGKNQ